MWEQELLRYLGILGRLFGLSGHLAQWMRQAATAPQSGSNDNANLTPAYGRSGWGCNRVITASYLAEWRQFSRPLC